MERPLIARKLERLFLRTVADFEGYHTIAVIDHLGLVTVKVSDRVRIRHLTRLDSAEGTTDRSPSREASIRLFARLESQPPPEILIESPYIDESGEASFLAAISKLDYDTGELGVVIILKCRLTPFLAYLGNVAFFGEDLISATLPDGKVLKTVPPANVISAPGLDVLEADREGLGLWTLDQGILAVKDLRVVPDQPGVVVAIGIPTALLFKDLEPAIRFFTIIFLLSLAFAVGIALYLSRYLSTPIVRLAEATSRLAQGDFSARVRTDTTGEVGVLVDSFNQMSAGLESRTRALRDGEARFRTLVDHAVDGLFVVDFDGRFVDVNLHACESLGYTKAELLALELTDIQTEMSLEEFQDMQRKVSPGVAITKEGNHRRKDGTTYPVEVRIGTIEQGGQTMFLALARDTTERQLAGEARRKAEEELEAQRTVSMRSDRLRSLGEMAAGIAHELNQPLVGVRGLAEHVLISLDRGWEITNDKLKDRLSRIVEQADRMVHIIDHIRAFAREAGKPDLSDISVNDVVDSSVDMVGAQFRSLGVGLHTDLSENLPVVLANPFSLEEVIINLLNNARDAIGEHSGNGFVASVTVMTRTNDGASGPEVAIDVQDTGGGVPDDILARIWDPFFTTKDPDKGTGLGLSISKGIVEEFGGSMAIDSRPGEGTTVSILLPAVNGSVNGVSNAQQGEIR